MGTFDHGKGVVALGVRVGHGHPSLGRLGEAQAGLDGRTVWPCELAGTRGFQGE